MTQKAPEQGRATEAKTRTLALWVGRLFARRGVRLVWVGAATLLLAVPVMFLAYRLSERQGMDRVFEVAAERLELYAGALDSELRRIEPLPALLALDEDLARLFEPAPDAAPRERAGRKLARLNARVGAQSIYAIAADGRLLASSEGPSAPDAARMLRVARDLRERGTGFVAAATTAAGTDFYRVAPMSREGRLRGWLVVRVNLAPLEATWADLGVRSSSERLLVVDEQDVVIMSSVPEWKYRTLTAVAEHWQGELAALGRYPEGPLPSLGLRTRPALLQGAPVLEIHIAGNPPLVYVAQERAVAPLALRFVALSDPADVLSNARGAALGAGALVLLSGLLLVYLLERQRVLNQLFKARNALQSARDDLEDQVARRTAELLKANAELEQQILQRRRSEEELIQASKLAVLGQMSAGMAHELNQPLTALRVLAGNTLRMLNNGRGQDLKPNLSAICDVTERMGRITSQLKTFARRRTEEVQHVALGGAIANARMLIEHRLAAEGVDCQVDVPAGLQVQADPTRLEQVLLNLMANALDSMRGCPQRQLSIRCEPMGERVCVSIADTGQGMDAAALARLFEPFFTTKPPGEGLGLGLVISSKIVREFGGTLNARRGPTGMIFEFDLARCAAPADHV